MFQKGRERIICLVHSPHGWVRVMPEARVSVRILHVLHVGGSGSFCRTFSGTWSEMEHLGLEATAIRDASIAPGVLTGCATVPAPVFIFLYSQCNITIESNTYYMLNIVLRASSIEFHLIPISEF